MFTALRYHFTKAWESLRRAPVLSLATIGMLTVVFLLFDAFALLASNVEAQTSRWIGSVRVCVFLNDDVGEAQAMDLASRAGEHPDVSSVQYVSRAEAKARFLADFPGNASILEGLPENPLPASLEMEVRPEALDVERLAALAEHFRGLPGVEDAIFGRELFVKLNALAGATRVTYALVGLILALAALFLTANTIRLNLYARRDEIQIMQLVGATRTFIRLPFLIEGLLQGALAALLSLLLAALAYLLGAPSLTELLAGALGRVELVFLPSAVCLGVVVGGAFLGMLASMISLGRHWSEL